MARVFLTICVLALGLTVAWAGAEARAEQAKADSPSVVTLRTVFTGTCQEIHRYAESLVGTSVIRSAAEFFEMVIRFLAEGAASGLNVIAVYVTEILRVTGFDATLKLPHFTPEGVTAVAQWGLVALIGYWLLSIVLRLLIGAIKQVFWIIKTVLGLWIFGLIVTDKQASADTTAVRLAGLVLVCVFLTLLTSSSEKSFVVEDRLRRLEGRVNAVESKKKE
ncbi:transmembrane protein 109 isoform X2 [Pundamilia nyererei]|uniref:Transmembrane protein 109 isoform X2 n=1 Tax=Pundamilia nyererei TaxID=303518 RepID=A0A9Y3QRF3_9CICH|nr:PREDICTED: transmembrane protein 109-like isoform X2 [Pundamilia nyererei]